MEESGEERLLAAYAAILFAISWMALEPESVARQHLREAVRAGLLRPEEAEAVRRLLKCIEKKRKRVRTLYEAAQACTGFA